MIAKGNRIATALAPPKPGMTPTMNPTTSPMTIDAIPAGVAM
jgi:hypothetical protein